MESLVHDVALMLTENFKRKENHCDFDSQLAAIQALLFVFIVHTSGININESGFLNVTVITESN